MSLSADSLFLKTKIALPVLKNNLVKRKRLLQVLQENTNGRLTLIHAPAGYGKTTLMAEWVRSSGQASAWISLDERDNDPARFWRYVVYALAMAYSDPPDRKLMQLAGSVPDLSPEVFLDSLINALTEQNKPVVLVMDDFHLITDKTVHEGLAYFLQYLPEQIHLLISTRTKLPFPTIKWTAKAQLTEISMTELQFNEVEAALYYQEVMKLPSELTFQAKQQLERLGRQTEGWITGMQLASLALRYETRLQQPDYDFPENLRQVSDYLFHEVFSKLPDSICSFLLSTSILPRMDAAICMRITGQPGSRQLLQTVQQMNLFLVPLDEQGRWFRYHHLFARFLQDRLVHENPEGAVQLRLKAAQAFADLGLMDEAIDQALAGGAYVLAETYLEQHFPAALELGELVTLLGWMERIPEERKTSLELALYHAFVLVLTGELRQAGDLLEQLERTCRKLEDPSRREELLSGVLFVRSNLMFMDGDLQKWLSFSESIMELLVPQNPLYFGFDYNRREPLVRKTSMGMKGMLSKTTETVGIRFTGVLEARGWHDSLINLYVKQALCEGYYEWNRLAECRSLLRAIGSTRPGSRTLGLLVPLRMIEARLYAAEGMPEPAQHMLEEAVAEAVSLSGTAWLPFLQAQRARLYLQQNKLAEAKQAVSLLGISAKDKPVYSLEFQYLTLVRLLGKQRKEREALRLLELLKPQAEREQQLASLVEISALQALLEFKSGYANKAVDHLQQSLLLGGPYGYMRTFLDEGEDMLRLLQFYLQRSAGEEPKPQAGSGQSAAIQHAELLIGLFLVSEAENEAKKPALLEPLNRSEMDLLIMLCQGASNKQIAKALALSEGTVRVYLSRVYGKLNVSSRTQALIAAQELRLLDGYAP
ncbi:LuxR C-terminal-related transcriptional regulator [Paenibacillus physcomitrellae]|uniref:LuxR family transcriptional regulator n=2 Tax=Paenibacillus physcomitrellae TaxID=1619311 RepID=A0ABQ1GKS8_9BACL|nr:LuxR C-terminal-related transcriptional regulator [Paenibacillus physcomitrellae]GGA45542.1 LuxR family transcriptional regulator [Paenibacillus physcomitrellae]